MTELVTGVSTGTLQAPFAFIGRDGHASGGAKPYKTGANREKKWPTQPGTIGSARGFVR